MLERRCRPVLRAFLVCILTMMAFTRIADAEGSDASHPHQGRVAPFQPGDPNVELDGAALRILGGDEPYQTQIESESGGRGLVVQDVKAPTEIVWSRILDFDHYTDMVPKTMESQNYDVREDSDGRQTIFTRMKVGFPMIKLQFFVKHEYDPALSSMTWTLDYAKKSDFDDSCGYWFVVPHPDNENWSRVYYSVEVSMFDWVPKFVVNFMSSKALTEATGWVKKYAELEYQKQLGDAAQGAKDDGDVQDAPSGPIWGLLDKSKQKAEEEDDDDDDGTCVTDVSEESGAGAAVGTRRVGLKRCAMVVSVVSLALYNVHLYLSQ